MPEVTITVNENGPLKIEGPVVLQWEGGAPIHTDKNIIFLCRCGASADKPFCDRTHSKIGFSAAAAAVPESAEQGLSSDAPGN